MNEIAELLQKIDSRLDRIDGRLDGIDGRLDGIDGRFNGNDSRFDRIETQLHKQGVLLEPMSTDLKQTMEAVVGNRQVMDREFAALRTQIDARDGGRGLQPATVPS